MSPDDLEAKEGVLLDREGNVIPIRGRSSESEAPRRRGQLFEDWASGPDPFARARQARIRVFGMSPLSRILLAIFLPLFILLALAVGIFLLAAFLLFSAIRSVFRALG